MDRTSKDWQGVVAADRLPSGFAVDPLELPGGLSGSEFHGKGRVLLAHPDIRDLVRDFIELGCMLHVGVDR